MSDRKTFRRLAVVLGICVLGSFGSPRLLGQATPGVYELSFQSTRGEIVSTLPICTQSVCEELILKAHIEDSSGVPANSGLVIFQYCSLKGLPPNDLSRPDEAPKAACESGAATWDRLVTIKVSETGDAFMDFGVVMKPRTVGFRFRYLRQGGEIASATSLAKDFTWVAATP
jgi:hypothetical protein